MGSNRYHRRVGKNPKLIGLISDTHGLLREEAVRALRGAELIVHAGDVGKPEIIEALRRLAPVVAVRGNVDKGDWALALPATAVAEAGPVKMYVLHDVKDLDLDPVAANFQIVVSGHSHKFGGSERSGVLYINPGSAGPKRFQLPVTIARLDLGARPWKVEFVDLEKITG
jgi:putative phosphoesterase